jgi:hypothetical protein
MVRAEDFRVAGEADEVLDNVDQARLVNIPS